MTSGRQPSLPPFKHPKAYVDAGRRERRLDALLAKQQKVGMLETLIVEYEKAGDFDYVRDLKKRVNEQRAQLRVLSTVDVKERP